MNTLDELKDKCNGCKKCALWETRTNVVFGIGNPCSRIMLIGEGPGESEDLKGEPFVGRAGKLLDDMLSIINLDRTKIYIANIVKCRPPGNRDPLNAEKDACIGWLKAQLEIIKPRIVVCLGRIAASTLIKDDFKITREHGQWFTLGEIKYMAIYHPAALLRDPGKRPETFVDLKTLQQEINS